MHEGHRMRMFERVGNGEKLKDHELLEILLYNPIPRKNTNEIAHNLLQRFGTVKNVLLASAEELTSVEGVGTNTAYYLKCVGSLFDRVSDRAVPAPKAFNFHEFYAIAAERFAGQAEEYIDLFSLDAGDRISYVARYTSHEEGRARLSFEEITHFLISHRPAGLVVAHNHPAGPAAPSEQDDDFTAKLFLLCTMNNVKLRDHVIFGRSDVFSYFMEGRMEEVEKLYDTKIRAEKGTK